MDAWLRIAVVYAIGAAVLAADLFIPSHGVLLVIGLGLFGYGLFESFMIGWAAGAMNAVVLLICLPTGFAVAIRNWHRTPIGRRISPPNPKLTEADRLPTSELEALIGQTGRSVTILRPVGMCEFIGRRIECTAECGVIDAGAQVRAVRLVDRTVVVRAVPASEETPEA
ncbi:MAG: hypothetical protein HY718_01205 [Planctomycetes bacterium]|nr:hypothetical protein [Planctomycetota bacterium]